MCECNDMDATQTSADIGIEWVNLHVVPGGGPSGMGISSSVSSSSSSLCIPGGGPSGMGISSSVFSTYTRFDQQASILE
jgi:hypothetical protein